MSPDALDRDAWITAATDALEQGGVEAIAVAALARDLGVTRGSFYWHFGSREELLAAVLERWERLHSDDVLDALERVAEPRMRLTLMLERAVSKPPSLFVRLLDGAEREPLVAATLQRSEERRMALLARTCRQAGMTPAQARRHALLCYSTYVGLARLLRDDPDRLPAREREAFARHLAQALVPPERD